MKPITDYSPEEQLDILLSICNKIYIARNISMDSFGIIEQLKVIDSLFK